MLGSVSVEDALADCCPERRPTTIEPQSSRPGNETWFVAFADGSTAYCKRAADSRRIAREAATLRYASVASTATVPTVIACDPTSSVGTLLTRPLDGQPLARSWPADATVRLRAVGREIARLHTARFDGSGLIRGSVTDCASTAGSSAAGSPTAGSSPCERDARTGELPELRIETGTWAETLAASIERRERDWLPDRFSDLSGRLAAAVREREPRLRNVQPRLLHDDLTRSNVFVEPPGLIDLERGLVGDPALDLVCASEYLARLPDVEPGNRPRFERALQAGYRAVAGSLPVTLDRYGVLYRAVAHLLSLQAFDSRLSLVESSPAELEADLRAELDRRLAAVGE